jgi:hypothetical protein
VIFGPYLIDMLYVREHQAPMNFWRIMREKGFLPFWFIPSREHTNFALARTHEKCKFAYIDEIEISIYEDNEVAPGNWTGG